MNKYLKLRSLTWWAAVTPLVAGLVMATFPLHGWEALTETVRNMSGDIPPAVLINAGLAGIGLRGAMK